MFLTQVAIALIDSLALIKPTIVLHGDGDDKYTAANRYEMVGIQDELEELNDDEISERHCAIFTIGDDDDSRVASPQPAIPSHHSTGSEGTLQDSLSSLQSSHQIFGMRADRLHKMESA
ncbi:hypothetical protein CspeluHIS016_0102820 [Cutaneotrichosporon spelunceum]|uniref:FHA domain-containing protein n=1 Tax=Cutaneotrichosporon spelunceum TaxID=1672016 RepID=A0AAD3TMJ2_9TREE|nr:hypothetical protein CspeluHIS016_0102820 [Cutaneotrichosporon spelunceum]